MPSNKLLPTSIKIFRASHVNSDFLINTPTLMKIFLLLFITSFTSLFGQKLKFDVMAKYFISYKNGASFESSAYAIANDDTYIMQVLNQYGGERQVAQVYNLKTLKMCEFKITSSKSENGELNYEFSYVRTSPFVKTLAKNVYYDFQYISTDGNIETVKLFFYKNKSKTKIVNNYELKILKSEANFFPLFRFTSLHGPEFIKELNYANGGLVTYCFDATGSTKIELTAFEEANLEIIIPN